MDEIPEHAAAAAYLLLLLAAAAAVPCSIHLESHLTEPFMQGITSIIDEPPFLHHHTPVRFDLNLPVEKKESIQWKEITQSRK